jgi:hypothetical protein
MTRDPDAAHDRIDPYDLVFGAESMDQRIFPPIAEEAEARGMPLDQPDRFLFLTSVGKLLQAIAGTEPYGGEELSDERKAALRHHGRLLFHAFHFWRGGGDRIELSEGDVRGLIDDPVAAGDWSLRPPASAGYLRLPRNLVWAAPGPGLTPEPADGFFWLFGEPEDEPARLHVLLVLGVRPDRPGFSVVSATGVLDTERHWVDVDGREDGRDFETDLPGGELDRLYSIETTAELLKLASRSFWHLGAR